MILLRSLPLFAAALITGCSEQPTAVEMPVPVVAIHDVESGALTVRREFIGRLDAPERVDLRARVSGILVSRHFDEGARVEQGQLLFEIERDTYEARVDQAEAEVASAEAQRENADVQLSRMEQLSVNRTVSEQDVDEARASALTARAAVQGARAALQQAELDLEHTRITATVGGRIGESEVDAGNLVGPDTGVLATLVSLDPIHVHFTLSDVEYLAFRRQSPDGRAPNIAPVLRLSDQSDYPHAGRLELIANEIDPGTGTLTARAEFPNPDELLRPGQFVSVIFEGTTGEDVLMVPQAAVLSGQSGRSVMVVDGDGTVEQRAIETGESSGDSWVVTSGLAAGDRVVVRGLQKIRPGMTVDVTAN